MAIDWDEHADGWDVKPEVRHYAQLAFSSLNATGPVEGLRVLDFGCGTGLLSAMIAKTAAEVVAIDTSAPMLAVLDDKQLANVHIVHGELTQSLIASHSAFQNPFDLVVASSVCGFVPDYEHTVRLIHSLLLPSGRFVQWDWSGMFDDGLTPERVHAALTAAGFSSATVSLPCTMTFGDDVMQVMQGTGVR